MKFKSLEQRQADEARAQIRALKFFERRATALRKAINKKGAIQEYDENSGWLRVTFSNGSRMRCRGPIVERALRRVADCVALYETAKEGGTK